MNKLKRDVLDDLLKEKAYIEVDNSRLSQNPVISYREVVTQIKVGLERIAIINGTINLLETYMPDEVADEGPTEPGVQAPVEELEPAPVAEEVVDAAPNDEGSPFPKAN